MSRFKTFNHGMSRFCSFVLILNIHVQVIVNFLIHVWLASYYNFVIFSLKLIDRKGEQGESVQSIGSIDRKYPVRTRN